MQNPCQPLFDEGRNITVKASAAVTGKRCVTISGNATDGLPRVATATAAGRIFGVAGYDAASGATLPAIRKGVVPITTAGAVTAGAEVEVGAAGAVVVKNAGVAVGVALFDAASGADAFVALY